MKWTFELTRLKDAKAAIFGLTITSGVLLLSNIILALFVFTHDETWILIPQSNVDEKITAKRSDWSDHYLNTWADAIVLSAFTVNPETVHLRHEDLLKISKSGRGVLAGFLEKESKIIREEKMTTAFYPKSFEINRDKKEIHVAGVLHVYFGRDRQPITKDKTYMLGYERGPHGVILLSSLKEKKDD